MIARLQIPPDTSLDPQQLAAFAKLRYVTDELPGIRRRRCGSGFTYLCPTGKTLKCDRTRERIERLAIPPAWQDVWICHYANGHLQATGRDDRQRKQYVYHDRWHEISSLVKFNHLLEVGQNLPSVRQRVRKDMRHGRVLSKRRMLATMVALLDATAIRIGNDEYAQQNGSYGLCTLLRDHVEASGSTIRLDFDGKSGQHREVAARDAQIAKNVRRYLHSGEERVFVYQDRRGEYCTADAAEVNVYLAEISNGTMTAKDMRTWKATALVAEHLHSHAAVETERERTKVVLAGLDEAADTLGNTRAVCRQHYVHPALIESYVEGKLGDALAKIRCRQRKWFHRDEQIALQLLKGFSEQPAR